MSAIPGQLQRIQTEVGKHFSAAEKQELARRYAGLVKHVALRMAATLPTHIELDDLINDGVVGLMDALNRFDPSKGVKFQTFAATRIRGAMLDALRAQDWASRGARRRGRELQKAEEKLCHDLGRRPKSEELARFAGLTPRELARRKQERSVGQLSSLEQLRCRGDESEELFGNALVDHSAAVEEHCFRGQCREHLLHGLKSLPERDRLILALYYFEELNIREIGLILGVSEARISQLHGRSLRRLRESLAAKVLEAKVS